MSRRDNTFNNNLQKLYPSLKASNFKKTEVFCQTCNGKFSLRNGGKSSIEKHFKTKKHQNSLSASVSSKKIDNFYSKAKFGSQEEEIAYMEGLMCYHAVRHDHSFRSSDCKTKIMKQIGHEKYSCSRTKSASIVNNVFANFCKEKLDEDLQKSNFVSISFDSSNHKDIKLIPIIVRYFSVENCQINVKILEFKDFHSEKSATITEYILEVLQKNSLNNKIISLCADNTNANFGGSQRNGQNNVFRRLENSLNHRKLIGVGCVAHILNNSIQFAADLLPDFDVQSFINKVYQHFHIYTVSSSISFLFCYSVNRFVILCFFIGESCRAERIM